MKIVRMAAWLLLAGPMAPGIDAEGEGGGGNLQYGGCASTSYTVQSQTAAAQFRVQTDSGFNAQVGGSTAGGRVQSEASSVMPTELGRGIQFYTADAVLGWQWKYGGADLGGALYNNEPTNYTSDGKAIGDSLQVEPAFSGWAGVPRYAYAWGTLFTEPAVIGSARPPVFLGVGHTDDLLDLRAGFGAGLIFDGHVKFHRFFQPGIDIRYFDTNNWNAAFSLRFTLASFDRAPD